MPTSTIVDPQTGKKYTISGPTAPSKGDLAQILKHLASSVTESPWWDRAPQDKRLAPLVRQLLGPDAYERSYDDFNPGLVDSLKHSTRTVGTTAEQMLRAGARPGEVLQKLGNTGASRRIGPYTVQELQQSGPTGDIELAPQK